MQFGPSPATQEYCRQSPCRVPEASLVSAPARLARLAQWPDGPVARLAWLAHSSNYFIIVVVLLLLFLLSRV